MSHKGVFIMKRRYLSIFLVISLMFCLFSACTAAPGEKEISKFFSSRVDYTFEEACDLADSIIIGTVSSVPEARVEMSVLPNGEERFLGDVHTDVVISVESTLKGEHKSSVIFVEEGGETEDHIYIVDNRELLKEGDRVMIFLHVSGVMLSPTYMRMIDVDGNISTISFPEGYEHTSNTISIDDYAALISDYLAG